MAYPLGKPVTEGLTDGFGPEIMEARASLDAGRRPQHRHSRAVATTGAEGRGDRECRQLDHILV